MEDRTVVGSIRGQRGNELRRAVVDRTVEVGPEGIGSRPAKMLTESMEGGKRQFQEAEAAEVADIAVVDMPQEGTPEEHREERPGVGLGVVVGARKMRQGNN